MIDRMYSHEIPKSYDIIEQETNKYYTVWHASFKATDSFFPLK